MEAREAMTSQMRQSLAAPPWDPEDWEWRPTVLGTDVTRLPSPAPSRGQLSSLSSNSKRSAEEGQESSKAAAGDSCNVPSGRKAASDALQLLVPFLNAQAELEAPRRAVAALQDRGKMDAYHRAIASALRARPGGSWGGT